MKTISTLALALSLAVGAAGFASVADAATTTKAPVAAAATTAKTPIVKKHTAMKTMHKKHKVMAAKTATKPLVKKS
jgi:hypothetical protein